MLRAGRMLLTLRLPTRLGWERIEMAQQVRLNGVFQVLTRRPQYPDAIPPRRCVLWVTPRALRVCRASAEEFLPGKTTAPAWHDLSHSSWQGSPWAASRHATSSPTRLTLVSSDSPATSTATSHTSAHPPRLRPRCCRPCGTASSGACPTSTGREPSRLALRASGPGRPARSMAVTTSTPSGGDRWRLHADPEP